ncbi:MAG TPA: hypothetical protein VKR83_16865 [Ktedonobacteraceae bacterium]|nr:hypothetical protein [Ktedonobacteraceae bacterium]
MQTLIPPSKQRFSRPRAWLRSRAGRIVIPLIALLLGIAIGIGSLFLYGLSGDGQVLQVPAPGKSDITIEVDKAFITSLVTMKLRQSGLPGTAENIQVDLANGDQLTINGDDMFSLMLISVSKHFTIVVQPYISNCVLQIHVIHADVSSIPVTGFAQAFESNINQQLQQKPGNLPQGFQYCTTGVRTATPGMFITYAALPTQ